MSKNDTPKSYQSQKDTKYYRSKEFKKLQRTWYGALRDSGFDDWEYRGSVSDLEKPYLKVSGHAGGTYEDRQHIDKNSHAPFRILSLFFHSDALSSQNYDIFDLFILKKRIDGLYFHEIGKIIKSHESFKGLRRPTTKGAVYTRFKKIFQDALAWYDASDLDE